MVDGRSSRRGCWFHSPEGFTLSLIDGVNVTVQ
jgi:hypothetical protein